MAAKRKRKPKPKLRKAVDETHMVRSHSGQTGLIREELWVDERNEAVKYNLAYVNHEMCQVDNGRVLGYDNAHGFHERHLMGSAQEVLFTSYSTQLAAFLAEVRKFREKS